MTRPYPLTQPQINTLKVAYKFRFITTHLLADYRNLTSYTSAYESLEKLVEKQYLVKRLTKQDKADRKNAIYYLSAKGIRLLRDEHQLNEDILRLMYKNGYVGEPYQQLHLQLFKLFLIIRSQYPGEFDQFPKLEAGVLNKNLLAKPDLYLRAIDDDRQPGEFFIYYITEIQLFIIKRLLKKILDDYNACPFDESFPTVLLVCPSGSVERRISEYLRGLELDDELHVLTTTMKALVGDGQPNVWTSYLSENELIPL